MVQACQTVSQFSSSAEESEEPSTEHFDANRASSDACMHIDVRRPNTVLLKATATGGYAERGAYTKALSIQISNSDGKKDIHEMHTNAVKAMREEMGTYADSICQIPAYTDTLNGKWLVLPKCNIKA